MTTTKRNDILTLEQREQIALATLKERGWQVTAYEPPANVEADELRGVVAGFRPGECIALILGKHGRRKTVHGISAVQALDAAEEWMRYQARLSPDQRFVPLSDDEPYDVGVIQRRNAGDTASGEERRRNVTRRELHFDERSRLIGVKESS